MNKGTFTAITAVAVLSLISFALVMHTTWTSKVSLSISESAFYRADIAWINTYAQMDKNWALQLLELSEHTCSISGNQKPSCADEDKDNKECKLYSAFQAIVTQTNQNTGVICSFTLQGTGGPNTPIHPGTPFTVFLSCSYSIPAGDTNVTIANTVNFQKDICSVGTDKKHCAIVDKYSNECEAGYCGEFAETGCT
ncbi:MAG: hypothetical protein V1847_03305 [Candidatus Diapherotrites archaeon]